MSASSCPLNCADGDAFYAASEVSAGSSAEFSSGFGDGGVPLCAIYESTLEEDDVTTIKWHKCHFRTLKFEMRLQDTALMVAYRRALFRHPECFRGKTVLDLTSSLGVFGFFALRVGAKKLIVHVRTSYEAEVAKRLAKINGFNEAVVIHGKIEDVEMPVENVDVILSDWMGDCLLSRSELPAFLFVRDRYLAPGGLVLPSEVSLYATTLNDADGKYHWVDWWKEPVLDFDMSSCREGARSEPEFRYVSKDRVMSESSCLKKFDMLRMTADDVDFASNFAVEAKQCGLVHAFLVYFVADFVVPSFKPELNAITTAPSKNFYSSWSPTILYTDKPIQVQEGNRILGTFQVTFQDKETIANGEIKMWWTCEEDENISETATYKLF